MKNIEELIPQLSNEKVFFNAFQFAAIGMALVAPDGKWLKVNKALRDIVGYSEKELLQLTFQDITYPDDLEEDLEYLQRLLRGELETYQMEKRYFHKDGGIIHILLSVSLVRGQDDVPLFFISQIQDITDRKLLEEELIRQARIDTLTGLNNRRAFYTLVEKELQRGERYNDPMVMLMIDIDHFKKINDTYGHGIGDKVLIQIAEVCKRELRSFDIVGRMGGEEFGALLINADARSGYQVAERLRRAVKNSIVATEKGVAKCSASVGGVAFSGHGQSIDYRLKQADDALYEAKATGRNRVVVTDEFTPSEEYEILKLHLLHLKWNESYECGNKTIDGQHRNLFRLANLLLNALLDGQTRESCQNRINTLNNEISKHFDTEEEIIEASGYPGLEKHKKIHQGLLEKAKEAAKRYGEENLGLGEVLNFLIVDVVSEHMLREDVKFYEYLSD